jgi:hypothetical protein
MSGLDPGLMTADIVLQTAPVVQSDSGEVVFDWDHAVDQALAAQWLPAGSVEAWRAQQRLTSYVSGVFRIYDLETRPQPDNTRIVFDGRIYDTKPYVEVYDGGMVVGLELAAVARGE